MPKRFNDAKIVIRRNEEADDSAAIVVMSDSEQERVYIVKRSWSGDDKESGIWIPVQFLNDLHSALTQVKNFIETQNPDLVE